MFIVTIYDLIITLLYYEILWREIEQNTCEIIIKIEMYFLRNTITDDHKIYPITGC